MAYNALRISMDQKQIMDKRPMNLESDTFLEANNHESKTQNP